MNNMQSSGAWTCACGFQNKAEHGFCASCGQPRPATTTAPQSVPTGSPASVETPQSMSSSGEWDCVCGFHNKRGKFCASCGMGRNESRNMPKQHAAVISHAGLSSAVPRSALQTGGTPSPKSSIPNVAPRNAAQTDTLTTSQATVFGGAAQSTNGLSPKAASQNDAAVGVVSANAVNNPGGSAAVRKAAEEPVVQEQGLLKKDKPKQEEIRSVEMKDAKPEESKPEITKAEEITAENPKTEETTPNEPTTVEPKQEETRREELKAEVPQAGASLTEKFPGVPLNRRTISVIAVAVLLLAVAFWGYGVYQDKRYASKCQELVVDMTETQDTAKSIASLSPNTNAGYQELANRFAKQAEQAGDLESALSGKSGSAASKEQYERIMFIVAKDREMLQKASEIFKTASAAKNKEDFDRLGKLHQEFEAARGRIQETLGEVKIPGQKAGQTISYQTLGDNMRAYMVKKLSQNKQYLEDKMQQYQARLQAENEMLKRKSEVVFLTESVKKDGNDLLIQGKFYNGTPEQVVGIGEMLVDISLNQFGVSLTTITDLKYEDPGLARIELAPGGAVGAIHLRLVGKAPKEEFNNFIVRVHKIHWKIRRLVKG